MTSCRTDNNNLHKDWDQRFSDAIVLITILYVIGIFDFFRSKVLLSLIFYAILLLCAFSYGLCIYRKRGMTRTDILIFIYAAIFPVICAFQSYKVFDQPIHLGLLSMRYGVLIFWGYFLCIVNYGYLRLLNSINLINLVVAISSLVLLLILGVDNVKIQTYTISTNSIDIEYMDDLVKGRKLTVCSSLMLVSYIYYLLKFLKRPSISKDTAILLVFAVYLLFVHKGRQPLAAMGLVYLIYLFSNLFKVCKSIYMREGRMYFPRRILNVIGKSIILLAVPILLLLFFVVSGNNMLLSFSSILDLTNTVDSSTLARLESIESVLPYIKEHYLLGFGNLSSHFMDNGFQYFFGKYFYLADIGIIAVLAQGGIFLLILYFLLYRTIFSKSSLYRNGFIREYSRYMVISFVIMLFLLTDVLFADNCIVFSSVFFPLLGHGNPNKRLKS